MTSTNRAVALVVLLLAATAASAESVVLVGFDADDPYHAAAARLARHHRTKHVLRFDPMHPDAIVARLREIEPTHVVVVLRPEQIHVDSVRRILKASTTVDADPFVDFDLGYITGATAKEASAFVDNIVRASRRRLPRRVARAAVWGGKRPCSSRETRYTTGGLSLPESSLIFTAPDGKKGRDQTFIDAHLKDLEGCGAIIMGGHGMPWEIGSGPRAEDLANLSIFPAVVFNYACYTGVTHRWPERVYESGMVLHRLNEIEARRSFALAMIRAGAIGYVAYVNPRPAGPELSLDFHNVLTGMSLGESRREDYAKIVLGYLGFGEPGITVGDWPTGKRLPVADVEPVRHMMLDGSTGGILYGDPAIRPYPEAKDASPLRVRTTLEGGALHIAMTVRAREVFLWCADPFRKADPKTRTMAMKAYARIELPETLPDIGDVRVASATWGGTPLETLPTIWAVEDDRGKRFLHVKPGWARASRAGEVKIELVATAGGAKVATPREDGKPDWLQRAREAGEYVLDRLDDIEGESVYDGAAGVALFLFELHAATGEERWLLPARSLLGRSLFIEDAPGLYVGVAGVGQVCLDAWRLTKDRTYLDRAVECARRLGPPKGTDIIYGAAGTGIFLLNLHEATGAPEWRREADALGRYLAKHARREKDLVGWASSVRPAGKVYPGFSHGPAGIGYFLLELHRSTGTREYRDLAEGAARFVLACAVEDGPDGYAWNKFEPPVEGAGRVQWCHGSPGIGLFFLALSDAYGGKRYEKALDRCLASTRREGRTARSTGIFCHGVSGNAELFLEAYRHDRGAAHLESARRFGLDLVGPDGARTTLDLGGGKTWSYGPDYMTGLAGVGRFFLELADPEKVRAAFMVRGR